MASRARKVSGAFEKQALKPTSDINSQILITPHHTFITNIIGRILFLIKKFLLSVINLFVFLT